MSTVNAKLTQALFPLLTATLLATACSDSTAPSPGEGAAGGSPAQLPADKGGTSAGRDQLPNPVLGEAPSVTEPITGDTATSRIRPSFLVRSGGWGSAYAPYPGGVVSPAGAVGCLGGFMSLVDIRVSTTVGYSGLREQYVVGEAFYYRRYGNTWVAQQMMRADAWLPTARPFAPLVQNDPFMASTPGDYKVVLRLTWYFRANDGRWVASAGITLNFNALRDYQGAIGATAGPGYCRIS